MPPPVVVMTHVTADDAFTDSMFARFSNLDASSVILNLMNTLSIVVFVLRVNVRQCFVHCVFHVSHCLGH